MAGLFDNLFGDGAQGDAARENKGLYQNYYNQGQGYLDAGYAGAKGNLNKAVGAFSPLAALGTKYGAGTDLYLNALGVNGAPAAQQAQQSFTTSPGYQQGIDAGIDVLNRRRAAGGMLNSGNADIDALTFGQNQQNQQYNGWLDRLGGLVSPELSATAGAATGQAAGYGSLANLDLNNATNKIGLLGNFTSGTAGANNQQAAAETAGAKNLLGFGMNLASLAAGGFGGGGLGSALGGGGGSLGGLGLGAGGAGMTTGRLY